MDRDEILINLVRENACIYDKSNPDYKDTAKKKELWQNIALQLREGYNLDETAETVEKRWASLRDMFGREKRKTRLPSGSGGSITKEWGLYKTMMFLTPHVAHRRTKGSFYLPDCSGVTEAYSSSNVSPDLADDNSIQNLKIPEDVKHLKLSPVENVYIATSPSQLQWDPSGCAPSISETPHTILPLDNFASHTKRKFDEIEMEIQKTNDAVGAAALSTSTMLAGVKPCDPYVLAIEEALKNVPPRNKTKCLIEILQVINKYEEHE